jgi:periplasmic divalent cation tolerance protein
MTEKRIVLTTAGSEEEAHKIAQHLVQARLAACVSVLPRIISIYRWKGAAFAKVRQAITELHSYELPECICLTIEDGSANYLQWIADSVVSADPGPRR